MSYQSDHTCGGEGSHEIHGGPPSIDLHESKRVLRRAADGKFEPLLSVSEAAKLLGVHPKTLQAMAREGSVPCIRMGKYWRFRESSLDVWVREQLESEYQSRRVQ